MPAADDGAPGTTPLTPAPRTPTLRAMGWRATGPIGVLAVAALAASVGACADASPPATPAAPPAAATAPSESAGPADAPLQPGVLGAGFAGDLWGGWQAQPIAVPPALLARIDAVCRASMQPFPAVPLVLVDARGNGAVQAQFAGPGGEATCMDMTVSRDGTVDALGGGSTGIGPQGAGPGPLAIESHGSMASGGPNGGVTLSVAVGRVGQGVASVAIVVPGKGEITTSMANGWYMASFPGPWPDGTTVVARDVTGAQVDVTDP